jgi:AraC-like DNA-binding protein
MPQIYREITPLTEYDCFTIFNRRKITFDFPVHFHVEYELNFILNGKGVKRVVGDHQEAIGNAELVLIGSNLPHGWMNHKYNHEESENEIEEVTIQFHKDLIDENFLRRNQLYFVREMLDKSSKGISFSEETTMKLANKFKSLVKKSGFDSVIGLLEILHELSLSTNQRLLSDESFMDNKISYNSRRIQAVFEHMRSSYNKEVTLSEVAKIAGMTDVSFSRFIKKRTGKTFIDSLNEIRLGHAARRLIDTTETISEIAYKCGFNNLSYFNRLFKSKKNCTPKQFREEFAGTRTFI